MKSVKFKSTGEYKPCLYYRGFSAYYIYDEEEKWFHADFMIRFAVMLSDNTEMGFTDRYDFSAKNIFSLNRKFREIIDSELS